MRASKRKRPRLNNSPGTSSQRLGTEKSSLTVEQISKIIQQIECKIARKLNGEFRKTENTILRSIGSLSENSLNSNANDMVDGTTLRGEESGQECLDSYGPDSHQEKVIPESVCPTIKQKFMTFSVIEIFNTSLCDIIVARQSYHIFIIWLTCEGSRGVLEEISSENLIFRFSDIWIVVLNSADSEKLTQSSSETALLLCTYSETAVMSANLLFDFSLGHQKFHFTTLQGLFAKFSNFICFENNLIIRDKNQLYNKLYWFMVI